MHQLLNPFVPLYEIQFHQIYVQFSLPPSTAMPPPPTLLISFLRERLLRTLSNFAIEGKKKITILSAEDSVKQFMFTTEPTDCSFRQIQRLRRELDVSSDYLVDTNRVTWDPSTPIPNDIVFYFRTFQDLALFPDIDDIVIRNTSLSIYSVRKSIRAIAILGFLIDIESCRLLIPGWSKSHLTAALETQHFCQDSPSFSEGQWDTLFVQKTSKHPEWAFPSYEESVSKFGTSSDYHIRWTMLSRPKKGSYRLPVDTSQLGQLTISGPITLIRDESILRHFLSHQ